MLKKVLTALFASILIIMFSTVVFGAQIDSIADESILPTVPGETDRLNVRGFDSAGSWYYYSGAERSTEYAYRSSSYSAKLVPGEGGSTYVSQSTSGLVAGAVYQLSAWVYRPEDTGSFRFGTEYYKNGSWLGNEMWQKETVAGYWSQVSTTFVMPEDATSVTVYCWFYGSDTVAYVDTVSLRMVEEAQHFFFDTDQVYYYTNDDVTAGTVRMTANSAIYSDYGTWTAEVKLLDGDTELFAKTGLSFSNEEIRVDFPLSLMDNPQTDYTVSACVRTPNGEILQNAQQTVCRRFPRPSMIDARGRIYVNGEEFMPVLGYHVYSNYYSQAKELGINVVEACYNITDDPEAVKEELDRLETNGLMAMVSLYVGSNSGWSDSQKEATEALIPLIKDHSALFGYCILDEPVAKKTDLAELSGAYEYIRSVDTVHPVYACDQLASHAQTLCAYNDIVGFDCYPYGKDAVPTNISKVTDEADFYLTNTKKPVITILQFFQRSEQYPYFPTADEMRNLLYQNYLAGGKGIGLYAIGYETVTDYTEGISVSNLNTPAADALRAWNTMEKTIVFDHFMRGNGTVCGQEKNDNMWWRIWEKDEGVYLLALNRTDSLLNTRIANGAFYTGAEISAVGGGDATSIAETGNGYISLSLPASAAVLYYINNGEIDLDSYSTDTGSWRLYKQMGSIYVHVKNQIMYTAQTFTIENENIKKTILFEPITDTATGQITELIDGSVKIKAGKGSTVVYRIVDAGTERPVPFSENAAYTVVTDVSAGQRVSCAGYGTSITIIAVYDERGFIDCEMSAAGEGVSLLIPEDIANNPCLKVFRLNTDLVPLAAAWEVR